MMLTRNDTIYFKSCTFIAFQNNWTDIDQNANKNLAKFWCFIIFISP